MPRFSQQKLADEAAFLHVVVEARSLVQKQNCCAFFARANLTFPRPAHKSIRVLSHAANFYVEWRARALPAVALREDDTSVPPEFLLQAVWHQQRLQRDQLRTLDGKIVRVLHPGFRNHEPGPDFRNAVVQIGSERACEGDVEIDLRAGGWRAHGHDKNPAFQKVVLHVIWEGDRAIAGVPTLALRGRRGAGFPGLPSRNAGEARCALRRRRS